MSRSRYQQPWERVTIGAVRCRVQVLDPETAFDLEPRIVSAVGDELALAVAAPEIVAARVLDSARGSESVATRYLIEVAHVARILAACVGSLRLDAGLALEVAETLLLGRVEVIGEIEVHDWDDWRGVFGSSPRARWTAIGLALRVTYGPLWTRSPYRLRVHPINDHGVKPPPGVSDVSLWCQEVAARGRASSAREILTTWTPVELIDSVESLAYSAEQQRRAIEAQKAGDS